MEIEAKFAVSDVATFQRLQAVEHVAGFSLSAHQVQQVQDTYLDTGERVILAHGYACRRRETEAEVLITLKALGRAEGAIHRRKELEISLPIYEPPQEWPDSAVRDLVLKMTAGEPLLPLLDLRQTRVFRRMSQGELLVAQFSLDNVRILANKREKGHFELEVELAPQGTANDMAAIIAYLQDEWNLGAEPRSKFERALDFLVEEEPGGDLLRPQERAICRQLSRRGDLYGRRAQGLLLLDEGMDPDETARRVDRTGRTVRRWMNSFKEEGLAGFPRRVVREVQRVVPATLPGIVEQESELSGLSGSRALGGEQEEGKPLGPEPQPLKALFKRYVTDGAHARRVASHAEELFDALRPFHRVASRYRHLVDTAAMVHSIGGTPGKAGHDLLLAHPPEELDEAERLMVALTTTLQGKQLTWKKVSKRVSQDPFGGLSKRSREEALALTALVRMADGLDYSQTQSTRLGPVAKKGDVVEIEVNGPYAAMDAARAQERSDLWQLLFGVQLGFRPAGVALDLMPHPGDDQSTDFSVDLTPQEPPQRPSLSADDTMGEAAGKTLSFHFQRMLYHEPGTRTGEDIEELHDMRVAARRMQAAFRVFGPYVDGKRLKPMRKGARRTRGKLGSVRDLDIFWEKTERYLKDLPPERQNDLMPLKEAWEAEREQAREAMLAYLDSGRYARFKERSVALLNMAATWELPALTNKGEAVPHRVRHVVPAAVYGQAAGVLAYDEWVNGPDLSLKRLHRLRIAGKRLRYTLEFFQPVLAPQTADLIKQMKRLQDHLGDLQDAVVASELLRDFITWGGWGDAKDRKEAKGSREPLVVPEVAVYLADKQAELQKLIDGFPKVWAAFQGAEFRQMVAVVVAPL